MAKRKAKVRKAGPKGGRPTDYRPAYCAQATRLALLGANDEEMADFFRVNVSTISKWKVVHPKFSEALARGKIGADAHIAESLYHRAKGYSHPDTHVSSYEGQITLTPIVKHYPPDTPAASLWLSNRRRGKWSSRQEITGADGQALIPERSETEIAHSIATLLARAITGRVIDHVPTPANEGDDD